MLVCRVALGRIEVLDEHCGRGKLFPSFGFDSAMAKKGVTRAPHGNPQLHDEFIIYNQSQCYPEFVLHYELV